MNDPFRRLDRMPFGRMLAAGVVVGLAVSWGIFYLPAGLGLAAAVVVIALAGGLAWSGQPVGIFEEVGGEEEFLEMVGIEGGRFLMGSPEGERGRLSNERQHPVEVSPFRISVTTVTRGQYREVMELDEAPGPGGDDHPVTEVSWFDAVGFCNRLSEREGLPPCYRIEGEEVAWEEDAGGYRLPTEAEWEYAARAETTGRWSFGDDESRLKEYAWFGEGSQGNPHPVAELEPNPWGLYDMHGNVWEWCWDWFADYSTELVTDPGGPETPSASRVLRGGSVWGESRGVRSAFRGRDGPVNRYQGTGFRCVRRPRRQP